MQTERSKIDSTRGCQRVVNHSVNAFEVKAPSNTRPSLIFIAEESAKSSEVQKMLTSLLPTKTVKKGKMKGKFKNVRNVLNTMKSKLHEPNLTTKLPRDKGPVHQHIASGIHFYIIGKIYQGGSCWENKNIDEEQAFA